MSAADIAATLGDAQRAGRSWHGGRTPKLRDGDAGRLLVWCFGGCGNRDILAKLRLFGLLGHVSSAVGACAAREAATRWLGEGRHVPIAMSSQSGSDFNNLLNGRAHGEIDNDAA